MTDLAARQDGGAAAASCVFRAEIQMAAPVEQWLQAVGASCIGHEVDAGVGFPDLMAGFGSARALRNRHRQAGPVVDPLQLRLLSYCTTSRSETDLRNWASGAMSMLLKRAIAPLLERSLLHAEDGVFRTRRLPKDPFDALVAVELKLSDVRRGVRQAASYRVFSDLSYLALPASRVTPLALELARGAGIGLLAVHPSLVEVAVEPAPTPISTPLRRRIAVERTIAASLNLEQAPAGSARGRHSQRSTSCHASRNDASSPLDGRGAGSDA